MEFSKFIKKIFILFLKSLHQSRSRRRASETPDGLPKLSPLPQAAQNQAAETTQKVDERVIQNQTASYSQKVDERVIQSQTASYSQKVDERVIHNQTPSYSQNVDQTVLHHQAASYSQKADEKFLQNQAVGYSQKVDETLLQNHTVGNSHKVDETLIQNQVARNSQMVDETPLHYEAADYSETVDETHLQDSISVEETIIIQPNSDFIEIEPGQVKYHTGQTPHPNRVDPSKMFQVMSEAEDDDPIDIIDKQIIGSSDIIEVEPGDVLIHEGIKHLSEITASLLKPPTTPRSSKRNESKSPSPHLAIISGRGLGEVHLPKSISGCMIEQNSCNSVVTFIYFSNQSNECKKCFVTLLNGLYCRIFFRKKTLSNYF